MATNAVQNNRKKKNLDLGGEQVRLGTPNAKNSSTLYLRTAYGVSEAEEMIFFRYFSPSSPSYKRTDLTKAEYGVLQKGLTKRIGDLTALLKTEMDARGDSVGLRQKLEIVNELKNLRTGVESAMATASTATAAPPAATPAAPLAPTQQIASTLTEEKIQELTRKFAILILHSQKPMPGMQAYNAPAKNVISRLQGINEPELLKYVEDYKAAGGILSPIIDNMLGLGVLGAKGVEDMLDERAFEIVLKDILVYVGVFFETQTLVKDMILNGIQGESAKDKVHSFLHIIFNAYAVAKKELEAHNREAETLQKKVEELSINVQTLTAAIQETAPQKAMIDTLTAEKVSLGVQITTLKTNLQDLTKHEKELSDSAMARVTALHEEITSLEKQVATNAAAKQTAEQALTAIQANLTETSNNLENARAESAAKDTRLLDLSGAIAGFKKDLAAAVERANGLDSEKAGLLAEIKSLKTSAGTSQSSAAELQGKIAAAESKVETLTTEKGKQNERVEQLEEKLAAAELQVSALDPLLARISSSQAKTEQELSALQNKYETLSSTSKTDLEAERALVVSIRAELSKAQADIAAKDILIAGIEKRVSDAVNEQLRTDSEAFGIQKGALEASLRELQGKDTAKDSAHTSAINEYIKKLADKQTEFDAYKLAAKTACDKEVKEKLEQEAARLEEKYALEKSEHAKQDGKLTAAFDAALKAAEESKKAALEAKGEELLKKYTANLTDATKPLNEELNTLRARVEKLNGDLAAKQREMDAAIQEKDRLHGIAMTAAAEASEKRLKAKITELNKTCDEKIAALGKGSTEQIDTLRGEKQAAIDAALVEERKIVGAEKNKLIAAHTAEIAALRKTLGDSIEVAIAAALVPKDLIIKDLSGSLVTAKSQLSSLERKFATAGPDVVAAKERAILDLSGNLAAAKSELVALRGQLEKAGPTVLAAKEQKIRDLSGNLDLALRDLSTARGQLATAGPGVVASKEQKIRDLSGNLAAAKSELVTLRGQLEKAGPTVVAAKEKMILDLSGNLDRALKSIDASIKESDKKGEARGKAAAAEKLVTLAAQVLAGNLSTDSFSTPENAPIRSILTKMSDLSSKAGSQDATCVLVYFVNEYLTSIFNENQEVYMDLYNDLKSLIYSLLQSLIKDPLNPSNPVKEDSNGFLQIIHILLPYLTVSEKIFLSMQQGFHFVKIDQNSKDAYASTGFYRLYSRLTGLNISPELAFQALARPTLGGPYTLSLYPYNPTGPAIMKLDNFILYDFMQKTYSPRTAVMFPFDNKILNRYRIVNINGVTMQDFQPLASADVTGGLNIVTRQRPMTYPVAFLLFLVATQHYLIALSDEKKLNCSLPETVREPFKGVPLSRPAAAPVAAAPPPITGANPSLIKKSFAVPSSPPPLQNTRSASASRSTRLPMGGVRETRRRRKGKANKKTRSLRR
jgi:chromosome segregation ATPase